MTRHLNAYQKGLSERHAEAKHEQLQRISKMDSYSDCGCLACAAAWLKAFAALTTSRTRARRLWNLQKATSRLAVEEKRGQA